MKREIRFRAWNTISEEMMYWEGKDKFTIAGQIALGIRTHIFMQYTGLHDKNGKEIYEGDIVKYKIPAMGKDYEVVVVVNFKPIQFLFGRWMYDKNCFIEVIGNIYENQNLLSTFPKEVQE